MLTKNIIYIKGHPQCIDALENSICNMKINKDTQKSTFHYFWGMKSNWFPLILLENYITANLRDDINQSMALRLFFNRLLKFKEGHSFYLDGYNRDDCRMAIAFRTENDLSNIINIIMSYYNVCFQIVQKDY